MSRNYSCLIVDDEKPAHQVIASHIAKTKGLVHQGSVYNGKEAILILSKQDFDIVFLDIEMPLLKGIEVLELLEKKPAIIITTAFSHFAFDAYQNDAVDYLLKPITLQRFNKAITKAKAYCNHVNHLPHKTITIPLKVGRQIQHIALSEIKYLQSIGNYVKVFLISNVNAIVAYGSLINLLKQLPESTFLQVHKSFIVNKNFISETGKELIIMKCDTKIPVGRRYELLVSSSEVAN